MAEALALLEAEPVAQGQRSCDWSGCARTAVWAVRFHGQKGHVHDCDFHTDWLKLDCNVTQIVKLPCPWPHDGTTWTDTPRARS